MGKKYFGEITISFSANGTFKKVMDMLDTLNFSCGVIEKFLNYIGIDIQIKRIDYDCYDVEEVEENEQ